MVTLEILTLSFLVRIQVGQPLTYFNCMPNIANIDFPSIISKIGADIWHPAISFSLEQMMDAKYLGFDHVEVKDSNGVSRPVYGNDHISVIMYVFDINKETAIILNDLYKIETKSGPGLDRPFSPIVNWYIKVSA